MTAVTFAITKCQSLVGFHVLGAFKAKNNHQNKLERSWQVCWYTPVIPAFGRLRQDYEFEVALNSKILS